MPLLDVRNLTKRYHPKGVDAFLALDSVSISVEPGRAVGIVGESGSGKTTLARCILRAIEPDSGEVWFEGGGGRVDLAALSPRALRPLRREMQMIFQDPYASLNPRMTVGEIVAEPLVIHGVGTRGDRKERVAEMLRRVGLTPDYAARCPHAFSGGQRQRIGIARALILGPRLVVADEAVSALDVSVRARVLDLLKGLQAELGLTYVFIAHDLSVVQSFCDEVAVMYRGRIVERGGVAQVFAAPAHGYTRSLLSAIPYPDPDVPLRPVRYEPA